MTPVVQVTLPPTPVWSEAVRMYKDETIEGALKGKIGVPPGYDPCVTEGAFGVRLSADRLNELRTKGFAIAELMEKNLSAYCLKQTGYLGDRDRPASGATPGAPPTSASSIPGIPQPLADAIRQYKDATLEGVLSGTVAVPAGFEQCVADGYENIKLTPSHLADLRARRAITQFADKAITAYCLQKLGVSPDANR